MSRLSNAEWNAGFARFHAVAALQKMIGDSPIDLFARVPAGKDGQTYLRSIRLVIDHNAYHLGQLVAVRQALGVWK